MEWRDEGGLKLGGGWSGAMKLGGGWSGGKWRVEWGVGG